jgi:hypothetical protein
MSYYNKYLQNYKLNELNELKQLYDNLKIEFDEVKNNNQKIIKENNELLYNNQLYKDLKIELKQQLLLNNQLIKEYIKREFQQIKKDTDKLKNENKELIKQLNELKNENKELDYEFIK